MSPSAPMRKVLMVHEYYRERGGEDESFEAEAQLLRSNGHQIVTYTVSNNQINAGGLANKARLLRDTIWAPGSYEEIAAIIKRERPDVAHLQNTFPLISPSAHAACRAAGLPVVQSLRNYRLICANSLFVRDNRICEDCLGKSLPWPAIVHACYRHSRLESTAVAAMLTYHRAARTWHDQVDLYLALTQFGRRKFIEAGLPSGKILVKPNFVEDPGPGQVEGNYVLFVGRLSEEKGVRLLLRAWTELPDVPLRIIGDGPLMGFAREWIAAMHLNVVLTGRVSRQAVMRAIRESAFVVFPSLCYETFGRIIAEAFACGKPVVAARGGAAEELVEDGRTGLQFAWNDSDDLARRVRSLWRSGPELRSMSEAARHEYLLRYTPQRNYEMLLAAYEQAIEGRST